MPLTPEQHKNFILSQANKLRFNNSLDSLMYEYKRLNDKGIGTWRLVDMIEEKVESILTGNEYKKWKFELTTEKY